jgi:hypothetical protein
MAEKMVSIRRIALKRQGLLSFWDAREGHALFLLLWFGGVQWLLVVDVGGVSSEYGMCYRHRFGGCSSSLFVAPFGWFLLLVDVLV